MTTTHSSTLSVASREPAGSRAIRRLRRAGQVPGVVYGGSAEPVSIEVGARTLRNFLVHSGAVVDLSIDGATTTPVMVKEHVRHPVNGASMHIDLIRVRMDTSVEATIVVDLLGAEIAPGVKFGGVLEQVTREITIAALPGDIPDVLQHDVSALEGGDTLTVGELTLPRGVTVVDDPETVIATITTPSTEEVSDEVETETEVVGEDGGEGGPEDAGDGETADGSASGEKSDPE